MVGISGRGGVLPQGSQEVKREEDAGVLISLQGPASDLTPSHWAPPPEGSSTCP